MQLRRTLDLYVNLIEIKSCPALVDKMRLKHNVDVVIVRQNVEGEFAMLEHENGSGIENLKIMTEYNTRRLAEFAFQYAIKHNRRAVRVIYNKGFMNTSEGLFVNTISEVAEQYPDVPFTKQSMRSFTFRMSDFNFNGDVLVTGVLYGGLIMYLMFGLMHGAGMFCGQNLGPRYAVFEPASRHKGYKQMGKDLANPIASLACAVKMLRYLEHHNAADRIEKAIDLTINEDLVHTQDMLGVASTSTMIHNIERRILESMPYGYSEDHPPQLPQPPESIPPYKPWE
uniref:Isopropylmalate dehydrogenase-like domain-containing protein n=2 Tax=Graphocephala atropunctata TaxID=36148 RepID=A0A1B6MA08_9HEMI